MPVYGDTENNRGQNFICNCTELQLTLNDLAESQSALEWYQSRWYWVLIVMSILILYAAITLTRKVMYCMKKAKLRKMKAAETTTERNGDETGSTAKLNQAKRGDKHE